MNIISAIKYILNNVDINSLNDRIEELENKLTSINNDNARKTAEIMRLEKSIQMLREDLIREQNKVSLAENKQKEFAIKLSESEKKVALLETLNGTLLETNENLLNQNASLKTEIVSNDIKITNLQGEKKQLSDNIIKLQEQSSALSKQNDKLKNALKESKADNSKNDAENVRLKTEIKNINEELNHEREKIELSNKAINDLTISKQEKESFIEDLQAQLTVEKQTNDTLKIKIKDIQFAKDTIKIQYDSIEKKYNSLYNEFEELNSKFVTLVADDEENVLSENNDMTLEEEHVDVVEGDKEIENIEELTEHNSTNITYNSDVDNIEDDETDESVSSGITHEDNVDDCIDSTQVRYKDENKNFNTEENKDTDSLYIENTNITDNELVNENLNSGSVVDIYATETDLEYGKSDVMQINDNNAPGNIADDCSEKVLDLDTNNNEGKIEEELDDDDILRDNTLPFLYDDKLIPAEKLSIPEVYDIKEEKMINSKEFFSQNENELILWRRNLQEEYLMGHARFICPECKQPVKISGHKLYRGRVCYFSHFKDSNDCPYKTGTNRTKEEIERLKYSLVQESERHKRLKTEIASALQGEKSIAMGVENVECEKRINSDIPYLKWRRPDIYAEYNGRKYVFELQLSTTFVSVIVDRDIFYRLNGYNIIWIFNFEDNNEYVNLYNLMCKDIYYANKRNVFIFDADAEEKSKELGELVLKCRWLDEGGHWSNAKYVSLEMLQYDEEHHKPFIFDADKAYLEKYPEYIERRKQLENSREYLLKALMERQKHEEELEKRREDERTNLQLRLLNTDKSVERFRIKTKYGYQFNGTTIISAKYTFAEDIGENGYAQVGFNRKIGLVRKDGKEILPVEYKNIDIINSQHGLLIATYKKIDLCLGDELLNLSNEFNEKEQCVIKEEENGKINYILQSKTYEYKYSQSYYGDHPICHKIFNGYSKTTLFSLVEDKNYCIIWVNGITYLLSNNHIMSVKGSFSDIISIGIDQLFVAKDYTTSLWGVIDLKCNVITEFRYAALIPTGSEYLIAKYTNDSSNYGVVDYQGREFMESKYEALIYLNSGRFAFRKNDLWGICDRMGNVLHEAEYTCIRSVESGGLRASKEESYLYRWQVQNNVPIYDNDLKLFMLNDKGTMVYTEQIMGQYLIRHSGELYSILSLDNKELVSYSLSYANFVTENIAIIKNIEDVPGLFVDNKCMFFKKCKDICHLVEDVFNFVNDDNNIAIGDSSGPISEFIYWSIRTIDDCHFIACQKYQNKGYLYNYNYGCNYNYFIIDKTGNQISPDFSSIDDFKDGYAIAIYNGRKGIIDKDGIMQEKNIMNYGDYILCEKFENYYFCNQDAEVVSEEYQKVDFLFDMFFIVKKYGEEKVRLFSLEMKKQTEDSFYNITHLIGNIFVVQVSNNIYYNSINVYYLYKGLEQLSSEPYSSIVLLENNYIALQKSSEIGYNIQKRWKLSKDNGEILNDREYDSIIEVNEDSFKVKISGCEGLIDLDGNPIIERQSCENNYVITRCFLDYGLEDSDGNIICSLDDHFSRIEITGDSVFIVCKDSKYALYSIDGKQRTEHKFSSIKYETNNRFAVVENNIKGHIDSFGNYIESLAVPITDDGITIFIKMEKYGLRDSDGNIIIPSEYNYISYLVRKLLVVKKGELNALFNTDGVHLTEFKYSNISCKEDGSIQVVRNKAIGGLNDNGEEIVDMLHFNGGYLQCSFGEYSVINEANEIIFPIGYSKIEILNNDGIFALWKGSKIAIGNIYKDKTEEIYESAKSIGNDFYLVSRTISRKKRIRNTGYGFRGNPYTYFSTNIDSIKVYGIIDNQLRTIIPCKYTSISDFDDEYNITATNVNGENKIISLQKLKKKASRTLDLSVGMEYNVEVKFFMNIGLVINIQGHSFVVHRKYLFKKSKDFKKGESFVVRFLGYDDNGYPKWTTKASYSQCEDKCDTNN